MEFKITIGRYYRGEDHFYGELGLGKDGGIVELKVRHWGSELELGVGYAMFGIINQVVCILNADWLEQACTHTHTNTHLNDSPMVHRKCSHYCVLMARAYKELCEGC